VLLLVAIYVSDALKIATFPTLLLLTTPFRLAPEVSWSSTRNRPRARHPSPALTL
jgi:type III secretory pathway component EscV